MTRRTFFFLALFLVVVWFLRAYRLDTDLLFHRDQGLHSLAIWQIWHDKEIKLLGPPSDVDGLIHAPIYYWFMLPAYALSGGSPVAASLYQVTWEVFSLVFLFLAVRNFFNQKTAFFALVLYTFSYSLISYSRWLVNVTPILPFTNFLLYLFSRLKQNQMSAFFAGLLVGAMAQFDAAIGTFLLPFSLWFHLRRFRFLFVLAGFFLPALPLLLFELRHDFVISRAVVNFSKSGAGLGAQFTLLGNLKTFFQEIVHLISYSWPPLAVIISILSLFAISLSSYRYFFLLYLGLPLLGWSLFGRGAMSFFFVPLLPVVLILVANFLALFKRPLALGLLSSLVILNLVLLPRLYRPTNALIPIGNANLITISDRLKVIDWVYQKASGKPFSLWFYTLPYYQEEAWQYLFTWYAQKHYGYLPEKTGGFSPEDLTNSVYFFAVFEPDWDRPFRQQDWFAEVGKNFGQPTDSFTSHDLTVWSFPLTTTRK